MVNRVIQQKILKKKRGYGRGKRYARFSGEATKTVSKLVEVLEHIDEDKTRIKIVEVYVGLESLSKQVPTGKGPNPERMQSYYARVQKQSFSEIIPPRSSSELKEWLKKYETIIAENPVPNRINLAKTREGKLDLLFITEGCVLIEVNYSGLIRMSRPYSDKKTAIDRLKNNRVMWVETIYP